MLDPDILARAVRIARAYPALEEIRADANRRRDGMARVMRAEPDSNTGWADAARLEHNAQGIRYSAAQKAAEAVAILADFGGLSLSHYDAEAWRTIELMGAELSALARAALDLMPTYRAAADRIPDCPTPYAHNLAHAAA